MSSRLNRRFDNRSEFDGDGRRNRRKKEILSIWLSRFEKAVRLSIKARFIRSIMFDLGSIDSHKRVRFSFRSPSSLNSSSHFLHFLNPKQLQEPHHEQHQLLLFARSLARDLQLLALRLDQISWSSQQALQCFLPRRHRFSQHWNVLPDRWDHQKRVLENSCLFVEMQKVRTVINPDRRERVWRAREKKRIGKREREKEWQTEKMKEGKITKGLRGKNRHGLFAERKTSFTKVL